jgi:hypothetical protein
MHILVKRDFERGNCLDHLYQGENRPLWRGFAPDLDSFSARQMYWTKTSETLGPSKSYAHFLMAFLGRQQVMLHPHHPQSTELK